MLCLSFNILLLLCLCVLAFSSIDLCLFSFLLVCLVTCVFMSVLSNFCISVMLCLFLSLSCILLNACLFAQYFCLIACLYFFPFFLLICKTKKGGPPVQRNPRSIRSRHVYLCCPLWCHSSFESLILFCSEDRRSRGREVRGEKSRIRKRWSYWGNIPFRQVQLGHVYGW